MKDKIKKENKKENKITKEQFETLKKKVKTKKGTEKSKLRKKKFESSFFTVNLKLPDKEEFVNFVFHKSLEGRVFILDSGKWKTSKVVNSSRSTRVDKFFSFE